MPVEAADDRLHPRLDLLQLELLFHHLARDVGPVDFGESEILQVCRVVRIAGSQRLRYADMKVSERYRGDVSVVLAEVAQHLLDRGIADLFTGAMYGDDHFLGHD